MKLIHSLLKTDRSVTSLILRVALGAVFFPHGAQKALASGRSLLPAGVTRVEGEFERGDSVRVVGHDGRELGRGLIAYSRAEAEVIAGKRSEQIAGILGYGGRNEMIHRDDLVLTPQDANP